MAILRPFLAIFCQLYEYLSQNWGSDDHFEVLEGPKSYLVQKLWHKMQIFPFPDLANSKWWMAVLWPFIPFFRQLCFHQSQNWGSDGHFECLTSLNLNWFKSYDTKCKCFHFQTWLTHEKIATDKWPFYDHFWPYFRKLCFFFHKT